MTAMATSDRTIVSTSTDGDASAFAVLMPLNRPASYVLGRSIFVKQQKDDLRIPVISSNEWSTYKTNPGSHSGECVYEKLPYDAGDMNTEARFTAIFGHPQSGWCLGTSGGRMEPVDQTESAFSYYHVGNDLHIDHAYAIVGMHPVSGLMTISTERRGALRILESTGCSEISPGKTHTFFHKSNEFEIGTLKFALVYLKPSEEGHSEQLLHQRWLYLNGLYWRIRQNSSMILKSLYPQETAICTIPNFHVCRLVARGQNTWILSAINKATGACVAVKFYGSDTADVKGKYLWERDCLQRVKTDRGFVRILDAGEVDLELGDDRDNDCLKAKWFLAMPLLISTFRQFTPWDALSMDTSWRLWRSSALALSNLDGRSIIHRNITLDKIGVLSLIPLQVVIIGFGSAVNSPSNERSPAPMSIWAPEMVKLARGEISTAYDGKADVWSWGLALLEHFGFVPSREDDRCLSEQDLQEIRDFIAALPHPISEFMSRVM